MRFTSLLLAFLALLAPAGSLLAQPFSGRYQARPGAVLACKTFQGCDLLQLEGSLDFEQLTFPFPGMAPDFRINGSHLRLRPVFRPSFTPTEGLAFPPESGPRLEDLKLEVQDEALLLTEPPGALEEVALELVFAGDVNLVLRGTYVEGCCDPRLTFDLGGIIFDYAGTETLSYLILEDRFVVEVTWQDFAGGTGSGTPVKFNDRAGQFWFFSSENPELTVKVLDACTAFGRWWFFAAGLTNVGVEIRVTDYLDSSHPATKTYVNPGGRPFQPILDTEGFGCRP